MRPPHRAVALSGHEPPSLTPWLRHSAWLPELALADRSRDSGLGLPVNPAYSGCCGRLSWVQKSRARGRLCGHCSSPRSCWDAPSMWRVKGFVGRGESEKGGTPLLFLLWAKLLSTQINYEAASCQQLYVGRLYSLSPAFYLLSAEFELSSFDIMKLSLLPLTLAPCLCSDHVTPLPCP